MKIFTTVAADRVRWPRCSLAGCARKSRTSASCSASARSAPRANGARPTPSRSSPPPPPCNIDLRFADAQQKQENQIKALRSFIAQKVDVIAFSPVVETGWDTVLQEARAAKIPVILTDRAVTSRLRRSTSASSARTSSRKAARPAAGSVEKFKDATDDVNIVELQGTVGLGAGQRSQEGLRGNHRRRIRTSRSSARRSGDFTRAKGKEVMEAFLKAESRKIHVLYAHNDDMAIGAIQAIEEAGLKPGKDILIVSIDAVKGAFEAMIAGKLNATIECNPLLGPQLMTSVAEVVAGRPIPQAHRRRGNRVHRWKRRSNTSSRASTDDADEHDRQPRSCFRARDIARAFPGVQALAGVELTLRAGEVHALMGQNGAGKSTLIKVLTGVYAPDAGSIELLGQAGHARRRRSMRRSSASAPCTRKATCCRTCRWRKTSAPGRYPRRPWTRGGGIDWRETERRARELLAGLGIELDVTQLAGGLPAALQQLATVARAVATDARVLILDEPTSSLDADEVQALFALHPPAARQGRRDPVRHAFPRPGLRDLRSHDGAAQRQVRRRIRLRASSMRAAWWPRWSAASWRRPSDRATRHRGRRRHAPRRCSPRSNSRARGQLKPMDIELRAGEVLGLAGLLGSGRTELARLLFALDARDSGDIRIDGKPAKLDDPADALQLGLGFCPEDRKHSGIVAELSVRENIALALQARMGLAKFLTLAEQRADRREAGGGARRQDRQHRDARSASSRAATSRRPSSRAGSPRIRAC